MPKKFSTLFMLVGIALGLAGCNSEASQQAEAQRHLDAARAKLSQANAGYVPQTSSSGDATGLLVYRQETMDAAFADLNKVMSLNAPPQQLQALRMSADIDSSAALHAAGLAAAENAVLAGRSTLLLGYLSAFEGSATRAASLEPQTAESLVKLQEEIQRQTVKREQFTAEAADLTRQLEAVNAEIQKFKNLADEGNAQAQDLSEKAFVSQGEHMYDLQDQASQLERSAAVESASAEQQQVAATDLSGRLKLARGQLDAANKLLDELASQVKDTRADTARLTDESAKAQAASTEASQAMAKEFSQVVSVHQSAVQKQMTLAGQKIDKAIADLVKAVSLAGKNTDRKTAAQDVRMTRLQLLAAYVDQAHIATSHAGYLGDLASTAGALAGSVERITPQEVSTYRDQVNQLAQAQTDLNAKAAEAIQAGTELALELAPEGSTPEDGDVEAIALKQKDRLEGYGERASIQ